MNKRKKKRKKERHLQNYQLSSVTISKLEFDQAKKKKKIL
jgi:hypothetical protein